MNLSKRRIAGIASGAVRDLAVVHPADLVSVGAEMDLGNAVATGKTLWS